MFVFAGGLAFSVGFSAKKTHAYTVEEAKKFCAKGYHYDSSLNTFACNDVKIAIMPSDLGITNVGTLPTSQWYFLKEWKRGITRAFTFGTIANAELELKITNIKAAEIIVMERKLFKHVETFLKFDAAANAVMLDLLKLVKQNFEKDPNVFSSENNFKEILREIKLRGLKETSIGTDIKGGDIGSQDRTTDMDGGITFTNVKEGSQLRITATDLGISSNVGTLPTSKWYFMKELGRGVERLFTFNKIKKAELELEITNVIAAEMLAVMSRQLDREIDDGLDPAILIRIRELAVQRSSDGINEIQGAIENYTKAQERLSARLAKLPGNSENPKIAKLLEQVDEKTAKHIKSLFSVFEKISSGLRINKAADDAAGLGIITNDDSSFNLTRAIENAQNNLQKTIAVSVDKDVNAKQRAMDEIARAEEAMKSQILQQPGVAVLSTRKIDGLIVSDEVKGDALLVPTILGQAERAKIHLDRAKKAFAEGKFGEAFGQARSVTVIVDYLNGMIMPGRSVPSASQSGQTLKTAPTPTEWQTLKTAPPTIPAPKPTLVPTPTPVSTPTPSREPMMACTMQYDPVCGIDGETHSNACFAGLAGVKVNYTGECRVADQPSVTPIDTGTGTTATTTSDSRSGVKAQTEQLSSPALQLLR